MLYPKVSHFSGKPVIFQSWQCRVRGMISSGGWFSFECHEAGTNLSAGKTGFWFWFYLVFFFLLMGDALFSFSMWKFQESHKATGCASTARGAAPSSLVAAGRVSPSPGTPRNGQGGKPGTTEAPFLGKAGARRFLPSRCPRADAAAAGDSQRAGERLPQLLAPHQPLISLLHSPMD